MRLIFLDIDGVLAPVNFTASTFVCQDFVFPPRGCLKFEPACVDRLNSLCRLTGAKIVVSSTWRCFITDISLMRRMLKAQGVEAEVVGMTPKAAENWSDGSRGEEIWRYMQGYPETIETFVVLDDCDSGLSRFGDRFVHTDSVLGLEDSDVRKAIDALTDIDLEGSPWKTASCGNPQCWCLCVVAAQAPDEDCGDEYVVVSSGAVSASLAKLIVEDHNKRLLCK